jgi:nitrogen fixation protein FixH
MSKQNTPEAAKESAAHWKIGLALLVGVFLVGMAASLTTAARRVSRVVDTDYYSHGLHYGKTQDGSKNAGLGWSMTAGLSGTELQVRVKDESGAPVAGGMLRFEPKQTGGSEKPGTLALAESAPGLFRVTCPASAHNELHGTLRFTRGEAFASRKLVLFN